MNLSVKKEKKKISLFLVSVQAVATKLDLPDDLVGYFSLFLVREGVDGGLTCKSEHTFPKESEKHEMKTSSISLSLQMESILHNVPII